MFYTGIIEWNKFCCNLTQIKGTAKRIPMRKEIWIFFFLLYGGLFLAAPAKGQFYNGLKMDFGKNRVQYYDFYWSYYRFDRFDVYFNEYGRDLAEYTANYADRRLAEIEDFFDYILEKRLLLIVYNTQSDFKQSNLGLVTGKEDYNIGGKTQIIKNKVILYFRGDHKDFEKQISRVIAEVVINEMLYNGDVKDRVANSSLINLPDWYLQGLLSYISDPWNQEVENRVRDGVLSGRYKKFNRLIDEEAVYAGHSFWKYIAETFGEPMVPNILYLMKIYKNVNKGFLYVLGQDLKELTNDWLDFYYDYFELQGGEEPSDPPGEPLRKTKRDRIFRQVRMGPGGTYIAYATNEWGQHKIWVYNTRTDKHKKIFKKEPKLEQVIDKTYPVLAWHPSGRLLTFIMEEEGVLEIYFYRTGDESLEHRKLLYFDKVLDMDFSPDGSKLVFSAVKDGFTDLFIHTLASATNEQLTRDIADDLHPRYLPNDPNTILFSSNRKSDTVRFTADPTEDTETLQELFLYDLRKRPRVLTRLAEGRYLDKRQAEPVTGNELVYLNSSSGIMNRYIATIDSTISYIDTTVHYRYFTRSAPLTNYSRNILEQDLSPAAGSYGQVLYKDGRYRIHTGTLETENTLDQEALPTTTFREERIGNLEKADSIEQLKQELIAADRRRRDTLTKPIYEYFKSDELIDVNHYIFEEEKKNFYEQQLYKDYPGITVDTADLQLPPARIYEVSFYNNYIATQVDFSFLNNSYQVFNGGGSYYNPGFNMLTQIGAIDVFEDYKITGGFRFAGNFDSNEYLLSVENLKGTFDKMLVFHRQAINASADTSLFKIHSHNMYFTLGYPFNRVRALKGTVQYRHDRIVTLSTDLANLRNENNLRSWAGLKLEYIFDNTRNLGVNLYSGTRYKIFGEYYNQLNRSGSDMFVLGADFRHYLKIHRSLIWANRFATSTSFGPTKLIYYLGGVDNWMGFLFNNQVMFDQSIPIDYTQNYGFQTIATNMRGFAQNVRNGNSFALFNSEIRWPVFRYFANHPLGSNFLNTFQVVGFFDIGTAWSGVDPWSNENAYDSEVIENGPVKVTLDSNREPIVAGTGFGLRAQLLGYFIRADWAWGIENNVLLPRIFYLSFSLDF